MGEETVIPKKPVGRPKGGLSGKYKNENGKPIGVMEWRKMQYGWYRKERESKLGIKSEEQPRNELIATTEIQREKNYFYYIKTGEDNTLQIWKTLHSLTGRKPKQPIKENKIN